MARDEGGGGTGGIWAPDPNLVNTVIGPGGPQAPPVYLQPTPAAPGPTVEPINWLGIPGLPQDIINRIDAIFRDGGPNAAERAVAYLRTTPWHQQTYYGFAQGALKGLWGSEAEYMGWKGGVNAAYRRYMGRDATNDELLSFADAGWGVGEIGQRLEFSAGFKELFRRYNGREATQEEINAYYGSGGSLDVLGRKFEGRAIVGAERPDLQYVTGAFDTGQLSEEELTAYGEQKAGLGSTLGVNIMTRVQKAMERVNRVFQGTLATGSLGNQGGILAGPERAKRPDVGY
jgi:hypothetical protein